MRTLDSLIWDTAVADGLPDALLICHDPTLDLTRHAVQAGPRVLFLDPDYAHSQAAAALGAEIAGERRLDEFLAGAGAGAGTGAGAAVGLGEMPKSLARLDYLARVIAGAGFAGARLVLGANNKHLSRGMNAVLADSFDEVHGSRGRGKFRCLVASGPREVAYEPVTSSGLVAFGGVFSGAKPDRGGELLRSCLPDAPGRFLDLGCGNGSVSRGIAGATATDSDADAVLSARAIGLHTTWDDAGSQLPDASFDTIALNPPFHEGTTIDATLVQHLLDAAKRLLAADGALYVVHNSHLRYRGEVERRFAEVEQVDRDATFTVLRARPRQ